MLSLGWLRSRHRLRRTHLGSDVTVFRPVVTVRRRAIALVVMVMGGGWSLGFPVVGVDVRLSGRCVEAIPVAPVVAQEMHRRHVV